MIKKNTILIFLSLIVFSGIFSLRYLTQLDSVYFYKEAYFNLVSKINIWSSFNTSFGGIQIILWLYPITYLAGLVGNMFNLDWNILVRLFFYFPSIFLSIYSAEKLAKCFDFGSKGKFLMGFIYLFNTYFILLIDGGQLGVMLAYAIFPLAVESIINLSFFKTITTLSILAMLDPRFLLIALVTGFLVKKFNLLNVIKFIPMLLIVLLINSYWLIPILKLGTIGITTFVSDLRLTTLVNPLFLYQPHWPNNEFGKITHPNFLFVTIPLMLIVSLFVKPSREKSYLMLLFVFFAFLIKGESDPLGSIYSYFLNNFNIASAFRDSTKFFTPLIIIYGLIVSKYYDEVKNKYLMCVIPIIFVIPLIPGLLFGNHNNLTGTSDVKDLLELKSKVKDESRFLRTIYIPSRPQLAYQTERNQAIDGRALANYLPFASDNYGSEDRFNFMRRDSYINYFRSLGISRAIYISENKSIDPIVADIENSMPEKYYIDKLAVVVGSPIGVEKLAPEFGALFIEDDKTNLEDLLGIPNNNLFFYLNNKTTNDLIMSGLKDKFIDHSLFNSNWAKYSNDDYLTWKYQLLIRDIDTKEINFDDGIILSTIKDEITKIKLNIKPNTKYKIFIRAMAGKDSKGIYVNDILYEVPVKNVFSWIGNDFSFDSETSEIIIKNNGGFNIIGQVLVIENQKYQEYLKKTEGILKKYRIFDLTSKLPVSKISFTPKEGWMIWNQSYHKLWSLDGKLPFAINSITNGFYIEKKDFSNNPYFKGQETLDLGVKITLASILALVVSYFGYALYKKHNKIVVH